MSSGSQLVVQMGSDEAKLWNGLQKIIDQQKKMEDGFGKVAKSSKKAEKDMAGMSSIGQQIGQQITGMVTGWLSVGTAISAANAMLQYHVDLLEKSKKRTEDQANGRRELNQIAESPEHLIEMVQQSKGLSSAYGVNENNVMSLIANATNYGFQEDKAFLEKAVAAEGANIAPAAVIGEAGGKLSTLFDNKITPAQAANAAFAAAKSSVLNFEQMAPVLPVGAATAVPAGGTPEEVIAGISVLAKKFKSANTGSERYSSMVSEMRKDEDLAAIMQKQGINAAVEKVISTPGLKDTAVGESKEAREGLEAMIALFETVKAETAKAKQAILDTGTERDAIGSQMGIVRKGESGLGDIYTARQQAKGASEAAEQITQQRYAAEAYRRNAALDLANASGMTRGMNTPQQAGRSAVFGAMNYLGFSTEEIEREVAKKIAGDRVIREGGSQTEAQAAREAMRTASMEEVSAELRKAAAELSAASSALKAGASANGANLQRQASSYAEK